MTDQFVTETSVSFKKTFILLTAVSNPPHHWLSRKSTFSVSVAVFSLVLSVFNLFRFTGLTFILIRNIPGQLGDSQDIEFPSLFTGPFVLFRMPLAEIYILAQKGSIFCTTLPVSFRSTRGILPWDSPNLSNLLSLCSTPAPNISCINSNQLSTFCFFTALYMRFTGLHHGFRRNDPFLSLNRRPFTTASASSPPSSLRIPCCFLPYPLLPLLNTPQPHLDP
jgi:hypothetical protein